MLNYIKLNTMARPCVLFYFIGIYMYIYIWYAFRSYFYFLFRIIYVKLYIFQPEYYY